MVKAICAPFYPTLRITIFRIPIIKKSLKLDKKCVNKDCCLSTFVSDPKREFGASLPHSLFGLLLRHVVARRLCAEAISLLGQQQEAYAPD
jgi:hypothetical protein